MTKLKIIEKMNDPTCGDFEVSDLKGGDMLYSYDTDTLLMVAELGTDELMLVDLTGGNLVEEEPDDIFENVFKDYNDLYGPFFLVHKAKITFKVK